MPINLRPFERQAPPPAYRPEQPDSYPASALRGVIASLAVMPESPCRISDEDAQDMQRHWLANAVMLGDASPNDLRVMLHQPLPSGRPVTPPRHRTPLPERPRSMICLGCGAPLGGLAASRPRGLHVLPPEILMEPLMFDKVLASIDRIVTECPFGAWMRAQGFDPLRGCIAVLPEQLRVDVGPFPPPYVRFSRNVVAPILMDVAALGLPETIADAFPLLLKRSTAAVINEINCP